MKYSVFLGKSDKLEQIKALRAYCNLGLKEAKDLVESASGLREVRAAIMVVVDLPMSEVQARYLAAGMNGAGLGTMISVSVARTEIKEPGHYRVTLTMANPHRQIQRKVAVFRAADDLFYRTSKNSLILAPMRSLAYPDEAIEVVETISESEFMND